MGRQRARAVSGAILDAGVLAQVWRNGRRQARLAGLLRLPVCEVASLDEPQARVAGRLLGLSGTTDVVDASVALLARRRGLPVVSSDADDLHRLDPTLDVFPI